MKKHVNRSIIFLLIGFWGLVVPKSVAQTIERAAMDCGIPYFYYPSNQLPNALLALNLLSKTINDDIPFCYCHIPSQFDALVFIREAKASIEDYIFNKIVYNYREYPFDTNKLLKELGE